MYEMQHFGDGELFETFFIFCTSLYSSYFSTVYVSLWCAHSRAVLFHTLHRGQRNTRLCPYLVHFTTLHFSIMVYHPRSLPIFYHHCSHLSLSVSASAAALSMVPVRYIPACSHHCIPTCSHGVLFISSYSSRIDRVAMNCATVFLLILIYSPIASNPTSSFAAATKVYSHFPSYRIHRSLHISRFSTWSWNPPRNLSMQGVTTQVYVPKSSTDWTTALDKNPNTRVAAPSLMRIRVILCHTTRALVRFPTTTGQSSSAAEIARPKYLKEVAISRGHPYTLKALEVTALSSSSARRFLFISFPFLHCTVRQFIPFRSRNGTRMSHRGHHGWGVFLAVHMIVYGTRVLYYWTIFS